MARPKKICRQSGEKLTFVSPMNFSMCWPKMPLLRGFHTTNLSLEQLKHPADLDHKRIYDRVLSVTVPVRFAGVSLRVGEKQAGLDWMRGILG
jgi:hypothetical protein